jgi:phosphoribosylformylglycinamidine cyclo-ligase
VYTGKLKLTDIEPQTGISAGKLVLSPTRTFLPVLKPVIEQFRAKIDGIIHCTGGAQTKVMKFVNNVHIIKNNLLPVPPLFEMIHAQSGTPYQEMFKVFNMGTRLEIYTDNETAQSIIKIAKSFSIDAQIIGYVEASNNNGLTIESELGKFEY